VGPIINILIGFFLGFSSGAGVIISQYFGAKDEESASKTVHTGMALTLAMALFFTVIGVVGTPFILKLMLGSEASAGEASVFAEAKTYLTIYFSGVISLMIYNIGAGYLRAIGDSQRPFYFLIVAAVTNTVLDLLFVFVLEMGVAGVALATVIAQTLSAILTLVALFRSDTCVKLYINKIRFHKDHLFKIIIGCIPTVEGVAHASRLLKSELTSDSVAGRIFRGINTAAKNVIYCISVDRRPSCNKSNVLVDCITYKRPLLVAKIPALEHISFTGRIPRLCNLFSVKYRLGRGLILIAISKIKLNRVVNL
jgi:hypothetical protein